MATLYIQRPGGCPPARRIVTVKVDDKAAFCAAEAEAIRAAVVQVRANIIDIGKRLIAVKARLAHGEWLPWLQREFGWSEPTAQRFMRVATAFDKSVTVTDLSIDASALYLLAGPKVPEAARAEAVERARGGERVTKADAQRLIDDSTGRQQPASGDADGAAQPEPGPVTEPAEIQREAVACRLPNGCRWHDDCPSQGRCIVADDIKVLEPLWALEKLIEVLGSAERTLQSVPPEHFARWADDPLFRHDLLSRFPGGMPEVIERIEGARQSFDAGLSRFLAAMEDENPQPVSQPAAGP